MTTLLIYGGFITLGLGVCCLVHLLYNWLAQDPRQILHDEDFRAIKEQEKILARGYIDMEE